MDGKITINIDEIRKLPNESITDGEVIRQISRYMLDNPGNNDLADKINPMMAFAGLYPHAQRRIHIEDLGEGKFCVDLETSGLDSTFPMYNSEIADKITQEGIRRLNNLKDKLDDKG